MENADNPLTAGGLMAASKNIPKDYSNKNTYFKVPELISRIFLCRSTIGHPILLAFDFVS